MRNESPFFFEDSKSVVKQVSAKCPLDEFMKKVAELNQTGDTVQIFHPSGIINKTHISAAYINAIEAFKDKANITKSVAMEMLLFAAMTTQISVAISKLGAKSKNNILVFASSKQVYLRIRPLIEKEAEFRPGKAQQLGLAKQYGIDGASLDASILQKISLSRLTE